MKVRVTFTVSLGDRRAIAARYREPDPPATYDEVRDYIRACVRADIECEQPADDELGRER